MDGCQVILFFTRRYRASTEGRYRDGLVPAALKVSRHTLMPEKSVNSFSSRSKKELPEIVEVSLSPFAGGTYFDVFICNDPNFELGDFTAKIS